MLMEFRITRKLGRATPTSEGFQAFFFDTSFFGFLVDLLLNQTSFVGFLVDLLLNQTSLFCSKGFITLLLREALLHGLQNSLNALLNCLIPINGRGLLLSLFCLSIAGSFGLQIPFATEGVISVDLIDALRSLGGGHIGHEAVAETVA